MLFRLSPAPTDTVKLLVWEVDGATPAKLVPPALLKYTAPAPGNGIVPASYAGANEAPLVDVSVYPFPLASA
jgi:hypothetical protein